MIKMKQIFIVHLMITLSILISITLKSDAQYCLPTYTIFCTSDDYINNFSTTGGVTNITNNGSGCNGSAPNNYIYNSGMTVSQIQGLAFNFSVQSGSTIWAQGFRIWIDWNHDFDFNDPGEDVYVSPSTSINAFTGSITVPPSAVPGPTRMRVLCRFATIPALTDYCGTNFSFGECEDYNMNVISATPCTGTPVAGTATALPNNPCPGVPIVLSLTGSTLAGGLAYQWQRGSSPSGPWVNIGITNPLLYIPVPGSTTWYRCIVTCTNTGLTNTSVVSGVVVVQMYSVNSSCWCIPTYANGGGADNITNVNLGTLNNNTAAAGNPSPFFVNYIPQQLSSALPIPNLNAGIPATLTINYGADPNQYGAVWIDFDHSGAFDASEYISPGTNAGSNGVHTIVITPPGSSIPGQTRMRIRAGDDVQMNSLQACGATNSTWGETEDYVVNILPAGPFDPALTNLVAPVGNLCTDSNQTLQATVCNYGSSPINLTVNPVTVAYQVYGPSGLSVYTQVLNTGILGSFGTSCQNSSVTPVNMFAGGAYLVNAIVSCPTLSNAFLTNDSLFAPISITNYRPNAGPDYRLCQYSLIPFGQGLTVSGCSAPIFDSVTINFTITGPCTDNTGATAAGTGAGANCADQFACAFANATIPALPPGSSFYTSGQLKVTNLSTVGGSFASEVRMNLYNPTPVGTGLISPGLIGNTALGSPSFTYSRPIPIGQLSNMFSLGAGSIINMGYWESFNDIVAGPDIGINAGGPTTATLTVYYQYVPPSFAWYDVPSGGSSLYSLSPFNPLAYTNAVVNNSNVPGLYTFYAACLGLPSCRVPVNLDVKPTPAAFQDSMLACEYAIGANNAVFNLSTLNNTVSGGLWPATSVDYYGDQALITQLDPNNDTSSTNVIYSDVYYTYTITAGPPLKCGSSDTVYLEVVSIPQFSLPIYSGFACAPNAIDISSLVNIFPPTGSDTLYFDDPAFTAPYTGNPHAISAADTVYIITQTSNSAACADSATAYIDVLPATNNIANQNAGNFSDCGSVGCGTISLGNGNTETLYTTTDCRRIATVTDDVTDLISLGNVSICEDIDCSVQFHNGQPYVNRHYEITPTTNGKATVCLYYLEQDFQDYDAAAFPSWPSINATSNLAITQVDNGTIGSPFSTATAIPNSSITSTYDALTTVWTVCFPVDSFSYFYAHTQNPLNAALPVTLYSFTGQRANETSVLNWTTSSEQNNSHFVVERSKDGKTFSPLSAKISSKGVNGNSSVNLEYGYTDVSPIQGHNYYRLQQVDIDGHESYSGTVDVYFGTETMVTMYPNPVNTELNIQLNTPEAGRARVKIMDATGRVVRTVELSLQAGSNATKVDMQSLSDGVYMVSISNGKGLNYTQTIRKK